MPTNLQLALCSWLLPVPITMALLTTALVYVRGWIRLWRTLPRVLPAWHLAIFSADYIRCGSPSRLRCLLLTTVSLIAHMLQHLLLMTVAAPSILMGAPAIVLLHGLPQRAVRGTLGALLRWPPLQHSGTASLIPWLVGWRSGRRNRLAYSRAVRAGTAVGAMA